VRVKTRARVRGGGEGVGLRVRAKGVVGVVLRADGTREGEGRLSEGLEGDAGLEAAVGERAAQRVPGGGSAARNFT